jgi:hypothetical protein
METNERSLNDILTKEGTITIINAIRAGELEHYLPQLKDNENVRFRRTLAYMGKYLDQYIKDKASTVREAVIMTDSSYVPIMVENNNPDDDISLIRWMILDTKLDEELWKTILARPNITERFERYLPGGLYALNIIKQLWAKGKPDVLSKTMTRTQLYQANNPLWAYGYNMSQIAMFVNVNHTEDSEYLDERFENADNYYEWITMSRN